MQRKSLDYYKMTYYSLREKGHFFAFKKTPYPQKGIDL